MFLIISSQGNQQCQNNVLNFYEVTGGRKRTFSKKKKKSDTNQMKQGAKSN